MTWMLQHRLLMVGLGLVVVAAAVAAGVWYFVLRSPGTQLDLRQALRLYRQSQQAGHGDRAGLPPSGVYRYRTSGGEQLSLAGISRAFPASTDMIVTDGRCATLRWEPLVQHTEGMVECPVGGGSTFTSAPSFEDIAGIRTTTDMRCPPGTWFVPPDPRTGEHWRAACQETGQPVAWAGQVVGFSTVDVDGHAVPAVHTRIDLTFRGAETGTNPTDYWVSLGDGLILRERETVAVSQSAGPLGSVHYREQMAISLASLQPVR